MQSAENKDFEIIARFDSEMNERYQMQGILVEEDSNNYLRFDFYCDGNTVHIFSQSYTNGVPVVKNDQTISGSVPRYMKVKREGDLWTQSYSSDEITWTTALTFTRTMTVTSAGAFVGNAGNNAPQYTELIDFFLNTTSPIVSDDFSGLDLNTEVWKFINPRGDAVQSMTGTGVTISVPAGISHNIWKEGNFAPRIMQTASDTDFEIEVKYESELHGKYQMQGIIIEEDGNNYLRFDIYSDGSNIRIFAASFVNDAPSIKKNSIISNTSAPAPFYMKIHRQGNQWTQSYSFNGTDWTTNVIFTHNLAVTSVGPLAGNYGNPVTSSPAFTSIIDYFINTATPINSEDS